MGKKRHEAATPYPGLPEDGVVLCPRCGKTVDLSEPDTEAFACEAAPDKFFCSNNCLREFVLGDLDEDADDDLLERRGHAD